MSFHYYPNYGLGLILTDSEVTEFAKHNSIEDEDLLDFVLDQGFSHFNDEESDTLECFMLSPKKEEYPSEMLFIYAEKQPQNDPFNPAYKSITDLADEFRKRYHEFFPEDFDYEAHLGWFNAVNWG